MNIHDVTLFKELHDLKGIPQPEKWHPEGDAWNHTMMVLGVARQYSPENSKLYLACICHDLGKARTPKEEWPKHYGHAWLGCGLTRSLLRRLGIDDKTCEQIVFTTKYHMHIHDALILNYKTYAKIYNEIVDLTTDDYDRIQLISLLTDLGVCDHFGRGEIINDGPYSYKPASYMRRILIDISNNFGCRKITERLDFNMIKQIMKENSDV